MKCPVDNNELVMSERSGVEIDYCPTCRGVWLDRGELDKIIDRSAVVPDSAAAPAAPPIPGGSGQPGYGAPRGEFDDRQRNDRYDRGYDRKYDKDDKYGKYGNQPHRKKESWLGDLFDF